MHSSHGVIINKGQTYQATAGLYEDKEHQIMIVKQIDTTVFDDERAAWEYSKQMLKELTQIIKEK